MLGVSLVKRLLTEGSLFYKHLLFKGTDVCPAN